VAAAPVPSFGLDDPGAATTPRALGPWMLALYGVVWTVGSAIHRAPSEVAAQAGSVTVATTLWALGAVIALCGALCEAELCSLVPGSGHEFAYLKAGWGRGPAFVFGWLTLVVGAPAAIAAVARIFGDFLATFVPLTELAIRIAAAALIAAHTALAVRSRRAGAALVAAGAVAKLTALAIVLAALFLAPASPGSAAPLGATHVPSIGGIGLALIVVLWSYEGFSSVAGLAGQDGVSRRMLPRGLLAGAVLLGATYVLANLAFFRSLGVGGVAGSSALANDSVRAALGGAAARGVAALVILMTIASVGAQMAGMPRVLFAMARNGLFFKRFERLDREGGIPRTAVATLGLLSTAFVLTGGFVSLVRWSVLATFPLTILAVLGIVRLRRERLAAQAFRMPWYPLPLVGYVGAVGAAVILSCIGDPLAAAVSAAATVVGIGLYLAWSRRVPPGPRPVPDDPAR
jgi:APA family basic amino acid/polyamine antiporter